MVDVLVTAVVIFVTVYLLAGVAFVAAAAWFVRKLDEVERRDHE